MWITYSLCRLELTTSTTYKCCAPRATARKRGQNRGKYMGRRGPAATPTPILKLRGSWLARERAEEPFSEESAPVCPPWLNAEGKKTWDRLVLALAPVLREVDSDLLARYCDASARFIEAVGILHANGSTYVGQPIPQVAIAARLSDQMLKMEVQMGMTPSARAALARPAASKGKLARYKLGRA